MKGDVRLRLSVMMFLQYFVWGAWFVTLGTFLGQGLKFDGSGIGWCYSALPIAAMISPFFVGVVADRFFATERVLGMLHLVGAGLMYFASQQSEFSQMFPMLLIYALCYMPTLALTNSLSFHQMSDPSRQFPGIRVWGTIGWIVAGTLIGKLRRDGEGGLTLSFLSEAGSQLASIEATRLPMLIAAGTSLVLGLFSFFLPHTPPKRGEKVSLRDVLGLDTLQLMRERSFAVFVIGSFLICIPLQFYYVFTNPFLNAINFPDPAFSMTFGQWSEIFFMLVMPIFFVRLGVKWMLLFGMLAWTVRYFLFSAGAVTSAGGAPDTAAQLMLYGGIILHGICYDFFFVTGQIYVDQRAPRALRSAAQGFIAFVTLGAGQFVGSVLGGYVLNFFETAPESRTYHWDQFWVVPAIGAAVVMAIFALFFQEPKQTAAPAAEA